MSQSPRSQGKHIKAQHTEMLLLMEQNSLPSSFWNLIEVFTEKCKENKILKKLWKHFQNSKKHLVIGKNDKL
jgi:hypothetical protein